MPTQVSSPPATTRSTASWPRIISRKPAPHTPKTAGRLCWGLHVSEAKAVHPVTLAALVSAMTMPMRPVDVTPMLFSRIGGAIGTV
ncbi:hypothetical protein [Streptomyces sp. NPDC002172]